jgi:hypothetical protein
VREIRTLRVTWRGPETELRRYLGAAASVPDPTQPLTKPKPSKEQRKPILESTWSGCAFATRGIFPSGRVSHLGPHSISVHSGHVTLFSRSPCAAPEVRLFAVSVEIIANHFTGRREARSGRGSSLGKRQNSLGASRGEPDSDQLGSPKLRRVFPLLLIDLELPHHSYLSATRGSTLVARWAGARQAASATAAIKRAASV